MKCPFTHMNDKWKNTHTERQIQTKRRILLLCILSPYATDLLKRTRVFPNPSPWNCGHPNAAWVPTHKREVMEWCLEPCRPLWASKLSFKWCKQTLSIIESINLLRVKGARNFTSLGLLPHLICQPQTSNNPTAATPRVPALLKPATKPQWLVLSVLHAVWLQLRPHSTSQTLLSQTDSYPIQTFNPLLASLSTSNLGHSNLPLLLYPQQLITP